VNLKQNVSLANYSTMRLGGNARYFAEAASLQDVEQLGKWAKEQALPIITVGGGSNIVWRDEGFDGLVIADCIKGREIVNKDGNATVKIGGGENWDEVVGWSVEQGLSGIEALSLIPGTAGATPVQNVEAYGQQIADSLQKVLVYDFRDNTFRELTPDQCSLSYRNSRFKDVDHGRFLICAIWLKLNRGQMSPPFHHGLQTYIDQRGITDFSPVSIRRAVIDIRSAKLPDPAKMANNGSFFKNPFVPQEQFEKLSRQFPDILNYPANDGSIKLSAMWLIEHAGFKAGYRDEPTGMALWPKHALVFINEHAKSTADLLAFRQKIVDKVQEKFGITLEQEPELLP
jgi:UDP-N-acetylmuramate dehydrogenase